MPELGLEPGSSLENLPLPPKKSPVRQSDADTTESAAQGVHNVHTRFVGHFVRAKVEAVFISVSASTFDLQNYLDELVDDRDNPSARAKKLIEAARQHNGEHQGVTVIWAAQGLLHEWHARIEWLVPLLDAFE